MTLLIVFFILTILVSFFCSLAESVLLSVTNPYVVLKIKQNKKSGLILKNLKTHVDQSLSAILTLNTFANTLGAAVVGAQAQSIYGNYFLAFISFGLTLSILIFSEIIPKTIGATHWKTLSPFCAYFVSGLTFFIKPVTFLTKGLKKSLSKNDHPDGLTREEVIVSAEIGADEGALKRKESQIIKNLLLLDDITVSQIMTPRSVIKAYQKDKTVEQVVGEEKVLRFSRTPVYGKDLDDIVGLLHRYKLLDYSSRDQHQSKISDLMIDIHTVPETVPVSAVLDQFIKRKEHLFVVVDEYGTTSGLVTLEDAVETLLGEEIMDEYDSVEDMRKYALERWSKKKKSEKKEKSQK